MKIKFLQKGDVIELKPEMAVVYDEFEHIFFSAGNPFRKGSTETVVYIGKEYQSRSDIEWLKTVLFDKIRAVYIEQHIDPDPEVLRKYVNYQVKAPDVRTFFIPAGQFVVTGVEQEGLGQLVYCESRRTLPRIKVKIYQGLPGNGGNHDNIKPVQ